ITSTSPFSAIAKASSTRRLKPDAVRTVSARPTQRLPGTRLRMLRCKQLPPPENTCSAMMRGCRYRSSSALCAALPAPCDWALSVMGMILSIGWERKQLDGERCGARRTNETSVLRHGPGPGELHQRLHLGILGLEEGRKFGRTHVAHRLAHIGHTLLVLVAV